MKNGFSVFLAAFLALGLSWCGFVLAAAKQLGTAKQAAVLNSTDVYPIQRPGDAELGLQIYRANGCAACHTERVRQDAVTCEISLNSLGKNKPEEFTTFFASLLKLPEFQSCSNSVAGQMQAWNSAVTQMIVTNLDSETAKNLLQHINTNGCKAGIQIKTVGVDIARGWGVRQSVAGDYLYDAPVQLGSLRAGPDLANIGVRSPDLNWQLVHLYLPKAFVKNSAMPPFRYLFELRKKVNGVASSDALQFPPVFAPPAGFEVVPTPEAKQLAAYLLSLKATVPLYNAPFTPAMSKP